MAERALGHMKACHHIKLTIIQNGHMVHPPGHRCCVSIGNSCIPCHANKVTESEIEIKPSAKEDTD